MTLLHPVILPISLKDRHLKGREAVLAQRRRAREALALSCAASGIAMGVLNKDGVDAPLPFAGNYWSLSHKCRYVAAVVSSSPVGTPTDWQRLWNWTVYRQPFGDRAARWLYVLVRRDLVPGSKYYSSAPPAQSGVTIPPAVNTSFPTLRAALRAAIPGAPHWTVRNRIRRGKMGTGAPARACNEALRNLPLRPRGFAYSMLGGWDWSAH